MERQKLLALFKGIAPQYLVGLYLALIVALGVVLLSVIIYPQDIKISERTQQVQTEKKRVETIENFILAHPNMDQHFAELQKSLTRAEQMLPASPEISKFLAQLEKDTKESKVELINVKPAALVPKTGYRELPVEVSVNGSFFSVMSFLRKMEDGERFSVPTAFSIKQNKANLSLTMNMKIFCFGLGPAAASASATQAPPGQPAPPRPAAQ